MLQRIVTSILFVPAVLLIVWAHPLLTRLGLLAVALICLREMQVMFRNMELNMWLPAPVLLAIVNFAWPQWGPVVFFASFMLMVVIVTMRACLQYPRISLTELMAQIFMGVYPLMFLVCALDLRQQPLGAEAMTLGFLLTWAFDTCAYLGGIRYGRHFLFPELSPKKSGEGLAFGTVGTLLVALIIHRFYPVVLPSRVLLITLGVAIMAPFGDLAESMIKRQCGVKDSGHSLPGHGGFLDRFDAFFFVSVWIRAVYFLGGM